jgi:hypothetical protein
MINTGEKKMRHGSKSWAYDEDAERFTPETQRTLSKTEKTLCPPCLCGDIFQADLFKPIIWRRCRKCACQRQPHLQRAGESWSQYRSRKCQSSINKRDSQLKYIVSEKYGYVNLFHNSTHLFVYRLSSVARFGKQLPNAFKWYYNSVWDKT